MSVEEADANTMWFYLSSVQVNPARFEHEACVTREDMNAFELGKIHEIVEWLTPEEYGNLSADEK